jgi:hypothetical protein
MKVAAAEAIAAIVGDELAADYVIPSPFDRSVAPAVAEAVASKARELGHVRPGSHGSLERETEAQAHEAARRAVQRAVARRFADGDTGHGEGDAGHDDTPPAGDGASSGDSSGSRSGADQPIVPGIPL